MIGRKIMAICDTEGGYACRLMEYLEEKRTLPYEIYAFTSPETLCDFAEGREIDLLLISEQAQSDQVRQIPAARRVVLTDGEEGETEEELRVCKYQAAGIILQKALAYSRGNALPKAEQAPSARRQMIGVFAPAGGGGSTLFAAALGQVLSGERSVLYLNLRSFSGLEQLSGELFERTLGDLLYYFHRDVKSLREKLPGTVRQLGALDYIPPSLTPSDLQEISGEEWSGFFSALLEAGPYDTLLVELSDGVRDMKEILGLCGRIYLPAQRDAVSRAAAAEFMDGLRGPGETELRRRVTAVYPPRPGQEDDVLLFASEGEAGRYVRQILAGRREDRGTDAGTAGEADVAARRKRRAFRRRDPGDHR